jgi:hypothetical protein
VLAPVPLHTNGQTVVSRQIPCKSHCSTTGAKGLQRWSPAVQAAMPASPPSIDESIDSDPSRASLPAPSPVSIVASEEDASTLPPASKTEFCSGGCSLLPRIELHPANATSSAIAPTIDCQRMNKPSPCGKTLRLSKRDAAERLDTPRCEPTYQFPNRGAVDIGDSAVVRTGDGPGGSLPNSAKKHAKALSRARAPAHQRTGTGVEDETVVPSPNWPMPLAPQHMTDPSLSRAQVWSQPAAICVTPVRFGT